ncbi:MAG TPA: YciI family protein [Ferruginibacter sp.]|nr:YciI family protein [Ferruginibacter sp.]
MKLLTVLLILISSHTSAQTLNKNYDSTLAKSLNADQYGMKKYVLVIIKTGTKTYEKRVSDSLMMGHMNNIGKLAEEGRLVVAGPIAKNDLTYQGIFIFNTADLEEAKQLVNSDPAIKAGIFTTELFSWYATAALQETFKIHKKLGKKSF